MILPPSDIHVACPVQQHSEIWQGAVFGLASDQITLSASDDAITRDYLVHPGAAAVVPWRQSEDGPEILLIRQYRHPVGALLWELPAGLLDHRDESADLCAQRELREEVDLVAYQWDVLVDIFSSPGCSQEKLRIFLARKLDRAPTVFDRQDEEADLIAQWFPLQDLESSIAAGQLHSPSAVVGIMAAAAAWRNSWATLRAVDSPWF